MASPDPRTIVPMKGQSGELPSGTQWVYELKWDGMRVIAFVAGRPTPGVRLQSSNGRDVTASFPELHALAAAGAEFDGLILDGEVVAFEGPEPSFKALQNRMHVTDTAEAGRRARRNPVLFVAFDLLHLDGHDTMALPLENRRSLLERLDDDDPSWTICQQYHDEVEGLLEVVADRGLEGVIAKNVDSTYQPGRRSPDWIKVKPRLRQEFVVGGFLGGRGRQSGRVGSLLLGYYDDGELRYAGRAGSGLGDADGRYWQKLLSTRSTCPFVEQPKLPRDRVVSWCEPIEIAEIAFAEWGTDGGYLRHPVVLGHRTDKNPTEVVRES